jgi:hypothetical protein
MLPLFIKSEERKEDNIKDRSWSQKILVRLILVYYDGKEDERE